MQKKLALNIDLENDKKIFFLSDIHLGSPNASESIVREKKLVEFLNTIQQNAQAIFFVGDIFDFWFEYRKVVPKNYLHFFAKILALRQQNIAIYFIKGNHDLWLGRYLEEALGVEIIEDDVLLKTMSKTIFITHGDGKGPGDRKYKLLKKIFTNKLCQFLFSWLHPDIGIKIAESWSRSSFTDPKLEIFKGEENEWLIQYAKRKMKETKVDCFLFGHRHLPMKLTIADNVEYVNLGDWIANFSYAVLDSNGMDLKKYEG